MQHRGCAVAGTKSAGLYAGGTCSCRLAHRAASRRSSALHDNIVAARCAFASLPACWAAAGQTGSSLPCWHARLTLCISSRIQPHS